MCRDLKECFLLRTNVLPTKLGLGFDDLLNVLIHSLFFVLYNSKEPVLFWGQFPNKLGLGFDDLLNVVFLCCSFALERDLVFGFVVRVVLVENLGYLFSNDESRRRRQQAMACSHSWYFFSPSTLLSLLLSFATALYGSIGSASLWAGADGDRANIPWGEGL
jgi:hypothetical protein